MIHTIVQTNAIASIGYVTGTSRDEKMSLPVAPLQYIYAQFKHVSGVQAPEGVRGVPITKLKILDCLIEQLSEMKRKKEPLQGPLTDEHIDALIEKYERQIYQSMRAGMVPIPYQQVPVVPGGMIFELVA
ncbi:MAG: hypothetical protein LBG24_04590 [Treponema sp.]|jgi:hypothetical protein|nr:hypothetical protein [Treponema sp.]